MMNDEEGCKITFVLGDDTRIMQVSGMNNLSKHPYRRLKSLQAIRAKTEREILKLIYKVEPSEEKV